MDYGAVRICPGRRTRKPDVETAEDIDRADGHGDKLGGGVEVVDVADIVPHDQELDSCCDNGGHNDV